MDYVVEIIEETKKAILEFPKRRDDIILMYQFALCGADEYEEDDSEEDEEAVLHGINEYTDFMDSLNNLRQEEEYLTEHKEQYADKL